MTGVFDSEVSITKVELIEPEEEDALPYHDYDWNSVNWGDWERASEVAEEYYDIIRAWVANHPGDYTKFVRNVEDSSLYSALKPEDELYTLPGSYLKSFDISEIHVQYMNTEAELFTYPIYSVPNVDKRAVEDLGTLPTGEDLGALLPIGLDDSGRILWYQNISCGYESGPPFGSGSDELTQCYILFEHTKKYQKEDK
ncbi:MAG: hypothetical protein ABII02_03990 [Candidatus Magasanikbacteria bacterium]